MEKNVGGDFDENVIQDQNVLGIFFFNHRKDILKITFRSGNAPKSYFEHKCTD